MQELRCEFLTGGFESRHANRVSKSSYLIERLDRNYFYRKPPLAQRAGLGGNA